MKKSLTFMITLLLLTSLVFHDARLASASAEDSYTLKPITYSVVVDGHPYIDPDLPVLTLEANGGNNTYVPLRRFAELLGLAVAWDQATGSAIIRKGDVPKLSTPPATTKEAPDREFQLTAVTYRVIVMGQVYSDPDLPVLTLQWNGGNNTYVPLRRFAQIMHKTVTWDAAANTAFITDPGLPAAVASGAGSPRVIAAAGPDSDGDGLTDADEAGKYLTNPSKRDSDGDGIADGDWDERREFAYSISARMHLQKPYVTSLASDSYQDVKILAEDDNGLDAEVVFYPLAGDPAAIKANPTWRKDYAGMTEYLAPGVTTNWDEAVRTGLLSQLKAAGIDPDKLTDKDLVENVGKWIKQTERWLDADDSQYPYELFIAYPNGVPTILPELSAYFPTDDQTHTKEAVIARLVSGKDMVTSHWHAGGISKATHDATIFRALGIPARMVMQLQVINADRGYGALDLLNGLAHNQFRETWKKVATPSWGLAFSLELYVGNRWVRYKNGVLGGSCFNPTAGGLYLDVSTFVDASELPLAESWGRLVAKYRSPFSPYATAELSDRFGAHSTVPNPAAATSDLTTVTVTGLMQGTDPSLDPFYKGRLTERDLVLATDVAVTDQAIYARATQFSERAGTTFTLQAPGQPDVLVSGLKATITIGKDPARVGYVLTIAPNEWAKVQPGAAYTLHPVAPAGTYRWQVSDGVTLIRR